jgi:hypothetical protein
MSNLAQNQLEFQKYNATMKGPSSPISMSQLKANADVEQKEQAALGKVFDATTASYVEREQIYEAGTNLPTPVKSAEEVARLSPVMATSDDESTALGKRKQGAITDFDKSTYEVYTTTPVADAFGNKTTRVIYMGREHYSCAKDARDVADLLRAKGMETFVYRCNRTPVKNRKRVKGPPRKKKPAVKKPKLKSIASFGTPPMGNWQFLDANGIHARGKQKIWFVLSTLDMNGSPANDEIRAAALCMKQCMAHEAVAFLETNSGIGSFIDDLPYHCNGETDKAKVRQMTLRIRQRLPGYKPMVRVSKPIPQFSLVDPDMATSSGTMPVAHASDASSHASASQTAHHPQANPLYTN